MSSSPDSRCPLSPLKCNATLPKIKKKNGQIQHPPRFNPPPLPSCAKVADKYVVWQEEATQKRRNKYVEKIEELDFHGFAGTVDGFRAYLAHKYGGAVRGWRQHMAPDEAGLKPVTWIEFCAGIRRTGYAGQAKTLWQHISRNNGGLSAGLEDLDPGLAKQLDSLCDVWADEYKSQGAWEAWKEFRREHACRANYLEFCNFIQENNLLPDDRRIDIRRIFDALDLAGIGTITCADLNFFDHWAHRRLGRPLHKEPVVEKDEKEPWSPPKKRPPQVQGLKEFRSFLEKNFGCAARAWRVMLDPKGVGNLGAADFGMGCRQAGWKHPHNQVYNELKDVGGGVVSLRGLDPTTTQAIDTFNEKVRAKWEDTYEFWTDHVDPGGSMSVNITEWTKDVAPELRITKDQAQRIFKCLDTQDTGWLSVTEIGFLDLCWEELEAKEPASPSSTQPLGRSSSMSAKWGGIDEGKKVRRAQSQSAMDTLAASSPSEKAKPPVWRTTRGQARSSFFSAHKVKYRWVAHAASDRFAHTTRDLPPTQLEPMSPQKDIFRATSEYYREGMKLWKDNKLEETTTRNRDHYA